MFKLILLTMISLASVNAMALTYSCDNNAANPEDFKSVSLKANGEVDVQIYEFSATVPKSKVTTITSVTKVQGVPDSHLTMVNEALVPYEVEGDAGELKLTVNFVYNPIQKAGRVTILQDGRTAARNLLLDNCK